MAKRNSQSAGKTSKTRQNPPKDVQHPTIGQYLIQRLSDYGVRHVFGIPGDFVLQFYGQLEESPIRVVGATVKTMRAMRPMPMLV